MPKNKGKFHSREPETPPTQELVTLSQRAIELIRPHAVKIGAVLGGVAVVLVGFTIWTWHVERREGGATQEFGQAMKTLRAPIVPQEQPAASTPKKSDQPTYKTSRERAEAALGSLQGLAKQYGSSDVANQGRLVEAGLLYDLQRYDDAIASYKKFLEKAPDSHLKLVAREGIGYAQEAKALAQSDAKARTAGLEEALKAFELVQPDEKGSYRDYALYHQARIKATLGDRAKAIAIFKQVLEKHAATPLRADINNRLTLLEEQG